MTAMPPPISGSTEPKAPLATTPANGPSPKLKIGRTILGLELRKMMIAMVNGLARGKRIKVVFRGTQAYTDGSTVVLPAIRDLAVIEYETARALMGYAIHEVAHVRYTDFDEVGRAFKEGPLVKKFENCIEDYRIERDTIKEYIGTAPDLTKLRVKIHPTQNQLTDAWYADPRACGPLALTWTGSQLNNFFNPHMAATYKRFPDPVMRLIESWTERMKNVSSTEQGVDLAIAFAGEAMKYADLTQRIADEPLPPQDQADQAPDETPQDGPEQPHKPDQQEEDDRSDQSEGEDADLSGNPLTPDASEPEESPVSSENEIDPADNASANSDETDSQVDDPSTGTIASDEMDAGNADTQGIEPQSEASNDATVTPEDDAPQTDGASSAEGDGDDAQTGGDNPTSPNPSSPQETDHSSKPSNENEENGGKQSTETSENSKNGSHEEPGVNDITFDGSSQKSAPNSNGKSQPGSQSASDSANIDMNGDLVDEYDNSSYNPKADQTDGQSQKSNGQNSPTKGDDEACGQEAGNAEPAPDPFADVLEENAELHDLIDNIRDWIRSGNGPLSKEAPEAAEGELDPSEIMNEIEALNDNAPDYISDEALDSEIEAAKERAAENQKAAGAGASKHHYNDTRFSPVNGDITSEDVFFPGFIDPITTYNSLKEQAAGTIATMARTIRRLLMAENKSGQVRNKRDGKFDIRNMNAIIQANGQCYKKVWTKPADTTLLAILTDFSGSMGKIPLELAMTGALAIEQATQNTQVNTCLYSYTGQSPIVHLQIFKEGKQAKPITRSRIGAYPGIGKECTPTGEAMAALAQRLEYAHEDRKILLVLTDGAADDMQLCSQVCDVLISRGIEVVAIGIKNQSVARWAPVYHVINEITDLPQALLATIDPRKAKINRRKAA